MRIELTAFEKAFKALPQGVTHAEVCADLRDELTLSVTGGAQSNGESFSRTTLYLRAGGDKTGTVLSEKLDEDPYALMDKALANARYSQAEGPEPMNPAGSGSRTNGGSYAAAPQVLAAALALEARALALDGVGAVLSCTVSRTVYARRVLNSRGLDRETQCTSYLATLQVKGSHGGPTGTARSSVESLEALEPEALARAALADAYMKDGGGALEPVPLASGRYRAVLSSAVTRNIMITAWQAFSGARMLDSASPFGWQAGSLIGSPALNITDHPSPGGYCAGFDLDSEGTPCQPKAMVREGRLVTPLHTLQSAAQAGQSPTGNAGRVAGLSGTTPINLTTIPSCIYIEPGEHTVEQLLAQMGDGVHLTYSLDVFHSINIASGEFSIPCGGVLYKDGRPVGTADQLTIAGNLRQLFGGILAVGDDLSLEVFMFYHNYCYGGPSLLVDSLAFTGRQEEGEG